MFLVGLRREGLSGKELIFLRGDAEPRIFAHNGFFLFYWTYLLICTVFRSKFLTFGHSKTLENLKNHYFSSKTGFFEFYRPKWGQNFKLTFGKQCKKIVMSAQFVAFFIKPNLYIKILEIPVSQLSSKTTFSSFFLPKWCLR